MTCFQQFESSVSEVVITAKLHDGTEVTRTVNPFDLWDEKGCFDAIVKLKETVVYGKPIGEY